MFKIAAMVMALGVMDPAHAADARAVDMAAGFKVLPIICTLTEDQSTKSRQLAELLFNQSVEKHELPTMEETAVAFDKTYKDLLTMWTNSPGRTLAFCNGVLNGE